MQPVWGRLVVKPEKIEETDPVYKAASEAGLVMPQTRETERIQHAQTEGILVSIGGNCFEDWVEPIPKVGDRVVYDKYSGFIKPIDGIEHRIISDTDILAIL
jgi:co-chaperonin GroES (HSP10)